MPLLTSPVIAAGSLGSAPQPALLSADGALTLRPFEAADAAAVHEAYQDAAIRRWHARTMESVDEAWEWVVAARAGWAEERKAEWAVVPAGAPAGGALLGRLAVGGWNLHEGLAVVGYWVVPSARGTGVARRALETATRWAFSAGFQRLALDHATENVASCRVAERAGYEAEGLHRRAALHEEGWLDMHVHACLAPVPLSGWARQS